MRFGYPLLLMFALAVPTAALAQDRGSDEQSIRKLVADFAATWNAHDVRAFGQLFAANADFVVITGKLLKGRNEIESYHADLATQLYKDSRLSWTPVEMRLLRPDVALAHVATEIPFNEGKERRTSAALIVLTCGQERPVNVARDYGAHDG